MDDDCLKKHTANQSQEGTSVGGSDKKTWAAPTLRVLRAGSAENTPGKAFFDGFLEAQGS